jgi:hypothetical protein
MICDCESHLVLGVVAGRVPGPDDPYFRPVLKQAAERVKIATLLADAGYDSEAAHGDTGAADVAGVVMNLRLIEDDVENGIVGHREKLTTNIQRALRNTFQETLSMS